MQAAGAAECIAQHGAKPPSPSMQQSTEHLSPLSGAQLHSDPRATAQGKHFPAPLSKGSRCKKLHQLSSIIVSCNIQEKKKKKKKK